MLETIISAILSAVGVASIVGLILMLIGKLIPNEKLEFWGFKLGKAASALGASRVGGWEKIEHFIQESAGVFLSAFGRGLDSDDPQ